MASISGSLSSPPTPNPSAAQTTFRRKPRVPACSAGGCERRPCPHAWEADLPRPRRPLRGSRSRGTRAPGRFALLPAPQPGLKRLASRRCSGSRKPKAGGEQVLLSLSSSPHPGDSAWMGGARLGQPLGAFVVPAQDAPRASGLLLGLGMIPGPRPGLSSAFSSPISHTTFRPAGSAQAHHLEQSTKHRGKVPSCPKNSTNWSGGAGAWHTRNLAQ